MPTEVATLCFQTRDAVERDDSTMTFEMPSHRLNTGTTKVALASCEFPMVQWTIEDDWNRLWLNEGVRLEGGHNTTMRVVVKRPDEPEPEQPVVLTLPPRLNPVRRATRRGDALVCECEHPHGLWTATGAPLRPAFADGDVRLVGKGDVSLSVALADCALQRISDTEFAVQTPLGDDALYVLTPTVGSPRHLCEWLTVTANGVFDAQCVTLRFDYDAKRDAVVLTGRCDVPGTRVRVLPDNLAVTMGLSTTPMRLADTSPHVWASEPTHFWDHVTIPTGFYAPCHRPMCTGQPLRLGTEMEEAVNRLYFPLSDRIPEGSTTPHFVVFSDPTGRTLLCPIPCGRYSPANLCLHLETQMTRLAETTSPGISVSVAHEHDRFVFACERRDVATGRVVPAIFGLLFHHPLSIDPSRLGFVAQPLSGSHTYVAARPTHAAVVGREGRTVANVLRISEISSQKRFRLHATHPPPMIAVVEEGDALTLRTHVNKMPFAHGYQKGDVVRVSTCGSTVVHADKAVGESPAVLPADFSCVVLESAADPCVLRLHAPALEGLRDVDTCLLVVSDGAEPWNLCFCKPKTLPPHLMGFPPRAVVWGYDGSVGDVTGRWMPPFEAPFTHCLDHPDYVLMTFSESSGAGFQHTFDGESRHIFCKLSLYPLFREERMLPRDTTLFNSNMARFTISFWNPDLRTPYRFHGAEFSFSLSFFSAVPDGA